MKYLIQFKSIPNYKDFCLPELKSLINMFNLNWQQVFKYELNIQNNQQITNPHQIRFNNFERFPFIYIDLPNEEIAQQIINRSVLIDVVIEVISEGRSYEEIVQNVDKQLLQRHNDPNYKISFEIDLYNSRLTQDQIVSIIDFLTESFHIKGKIDIKNSQKKFWIMERHVDPYTKFTDSSITQTLLNIFFGAEIAKSKSSFRISQKDNFLYQYDLKNRVYLGPTTTDNLLAFLITNQAKIKPNDLVFDPFVGSGSLLIPPSHYGAVCYGEDLDLRVLHGFGVGRLNKKSNFYKEKSSYCEMMKPKIMLNFEQYNFSQPEIIRMDCVHNNFRKIEIFDAIICDPPYGVRAMTRTKGRKKPPNNKKNEKNNQDIEEEEEEQKENNLQDIDNSIFEQNNIESVEEKPLNQKKDISDQQKENFTEENQLCQKITQVLNINGNQENINCLKNINQDDQYIEDEILQQKEQQENDDNSGVDGQQSTMQSQDSQTFEKKEKKYNQGRKIIYNAKNIQTVSTSVDHIVQGLFQLANQMLVKGGILVFLYPIDRQIYAEKNVSNLQHENFNLIDYSENILTGNKSRILVTFQKKI